MVVKHRANQPVDKHVGVKVRARRLLKGLTQTELADKVGITFQQIQKYERGANRISASRLHQFSKILEAPISYFFDGIESGEMLTLDSVKKRSFSDNAQIAMEMDIDSEDYQHIMAQKDTIKIVRAYYGIKDAKLRKQLLEMAKTMAKQFA